MTRDPIQSLGDSIKDMLDERPKSCAYYYSWEYQANRTESLKLEHKIRKILGEKTVKRIWSLYSRIEQLRWRNASRDWRIMLRAWIK